MLFSKMQGWEVLEIKGPDAKDFLHRLTSADFKNLKTNQLIEGALLQHTGKVLLFFKAFLHNDQYLLFVPPALGAKKAHELFEKLHFRENLTLTPITEDWAYIRVLTFEESSLPKLDLPSTFSFEENVWAKKDWGIFFPKTHLPEIKSLLKKTGFEEVSSLESFRILAMDPAYPQEINENTMALEAGLDRALHENKGCYPGQEVIERIRTMGQTPRRLVFCKGQGEPPIAPQIILNQTKPEHDRDGNATKYNEAGTLTSVTQNPQDKPSELLAPLSLAKASGEHSTWIGLGLLKKTFLKEEFNFTVQNQLISVQWKKN